MAADAPVDIETLIDERPLSAFQAWSIGLCALVALLDGFDTLSIGFAAPPMSRSLGVTMSAFAPVFSAGLFGAMVGALALGAAADKLGRKVVLIVSTLLFAAFTFATAQSQGMGDLILYRFMAGLGLGGATPCFIALTTEYAPARLRGRLVAAMWAAFPLGGVIGGFVNPVLLEQFGWRSLFYVGTVIPTVVAVILIVGLPESLRFLIARGGDDGRVRRIVDRIAKGLPADARFVSRGPPAGGALLRSPFVTGRPLATVFLWAIFFCTFMMLAFMPLWVISLMVHPGGLDVKGGALVVVMNTLGAAVGTAGLGRAFDRPDATRFLMLTYLIGGAAIGGLGFTGDSLPAGAVLGFLGGFAIGGASGGAIALAASLYPTAARSTGVGWSMAMGRLGQVIGPLIAGALLARAIGANGIFPAIGLFGAVAAFCVFMLSGNTRRFGAQQSQADPGVPAA